MPSVVRTPAPNRLLDALPRKTLQLIRRECELVELTFGDILYERDERIRKVYFPTTSFISEVVVMGDDNSLEVGLIGDEGMLGMPLVLGVESSSLRALVQGSGGALCIQAVHFRRVLAANPALQRRLDRYAHVLLVQLAQTAACTCFHVLDARLARWLLMTHDRAHADHFYLTHDLLARMLGVRRSGVTNAAGILQRRKLIRYSRGEITILDRNGLERVSCECYRVVTDAYQQIFG